MRRARFLSLACIFTLLLAGCSLFGQTAGRPAGVEQTTSAANIEREVTPPSPSVTPTPQRTVPPTRTPQPTPTTRVIIREPILVTNLGKGVISPGFISPDKNLILQQQEDQVRIYDAHTLQELGAVPGNELGMEWVKFSPSGKLAAYDIGMTFGVINLETFELIAAVEDIGFGFAVDPYFSADERYIAYRNTNSISSGSYHFIGVWDLSQNTGVYGSGDYGDSLPVLMPERTHTMGSPAISPDGKLIAAGCSDKLVYVWDMASGEIRFTLEGHASRVTSVDFSPDGRLLASGSRDGTVRLWNPLTGKPVRTFAGFTDDVIDIRFSAGSDFLIVSIPGQPDQRLDLSNGQIRALIEAETQPSNPIMLEMHRQGFSAGSSYDINPVLFSPDGKWLAVASSHVLLWDTVTREVLYTLEGGGGGTLVGISFSPDQKLLAALDRAGQVLVWDTETGERVQVLSSQSPTPEGAALFINGGPAQGIGPGIGAGVHTELGLSFSPDSRLLAFGSQNSVVVWDLAQKQQAALLSATPGGVVTSLSFSADGQRLYAIINRNRSAHVWDLATSTLLKEVDLPNVDPNAFTATSLVGSRFARNNYAGNQYWIEVWDLETEQMTRLETTGRETEPLAISPDGALLMALVQDHLLFWKTETGELVYRSKEKFDLSGIAFRPDNQRIAVGRGGVATILEISSIEQAARQNAFSPVSLPTPTQDPWDSQTDRTPTPQPTRFATPFPLAELPSGAITRSDAGEVVELARYGQGNILQVQWTEADQLVVAGSQGEYTYSANDLSLTGQKLLAELPGSGESTLSPDGQLLAFYVSSPVFSPDSRLVAAIREDDSVRVWEARTGRIITSLAGPDNTITDLAFSSDGKWITAAAGGSAFVWDLNPGSPPLRFDLYPVEISGNLNLYPEQVTAAALSPDSRLLAVGTTESSIFLYNRQSKSLVRELKHSAGAPVRLRFSPDGRRLLSASRDGELAIWTIPAGERIATAFEHLGAVQGLVHGSNGDLIAWAGNTAWKLDFKTAQKQQSISVPTGRLLAASPDGNWLAVAAGLQVELWDARTGQIVMTLEGVAEEIYVEYFDEGEYFRQFNTAVFSPDSRRLLALGSGGAWLYEIPGGRLLYHLAGYSSSLAAFAPGGDTFVTQLFLHDQPTLYDAALGVETLKLETERYTNYQYAFSADGRFAGAVRHNWGGPAMLAVWDTQTGIMHQTLAFDEEKLLTSLAFSPDGSLVAVGQEDGQIYLVDLESMEVIMALTGHRDRVTGLVFSADGLYLASGSLDGTVRIWGVR